MELSVIIVSYNVRYFLKQCLHSVQNASENIDCEILVIDNNSTDGSCSMIRTEFPGVKLIMNNVNMGFSAANNQALRIAGGSFILLLNPDTIVEEDTFSKCITFMKGHPRAGALGARMIDGRGKVLPESKRGLPTPATAFYKIFGLSYIFPKSRIFNSYYMSHIDDLQTAEVDILTGAFMFLRKEAVKKTGLLDESFFMYGEDIDYSYRLKKAGFRNYYCPEIKIVHYKGESTKKENLNVLLNFYKAMIIFFRKHFSKESPGALVFLIHLAIIFRAAISFLKQIMKRLILPLADALVIYLLYRLVTDLWGNFRFGPEYSYPGTFTHLIIPVYTLILTMSIIAISGIKPPLKVEDSVKGVVTGTLIILVTYAILPLHLRFSRSVIIIGGLLSIFMVPAVRLTISLMLPEIAENPFAKNRKTIIVSDHSGYDQIKALMQRINYSNIIAGRVNIKRDDLSKEVLGSLDQIREIIRVNKVREVIFASSELSASAIIESMAHISDLNIKIKIASPDGKYIVGSRHVSHSGSTISFGKTDLKPGFINKFKNLLR